MLAIEDFSYASHLILRKSFLLISSTKPVFIDSGWITLGKTVQVISYLNFFVQACFHYFYVAADAEAYPKNAVKAFHEKPMPTHQEQTNFIKNTHKNKLLGSFFLTSLIRIIDCLFHKTMLLIHFLSLDCFAFARWVRATSRRSSSSQSSSRSTTRPQSWPGHNKSFWSFVVHSQWSYFFKRNIIIW